MRHILSVNRTRLPFALTAGVLLLASLPAPAQKVSDWPIHSMERPKPRKVRAGQPDRLAPAPSDAIVLFDGSSLANWRSADSASAPARWRIRAGAMEVVSGTGAIATARAFGDAQLHIEWMSPAPPKGTGQDRGNSGVFFLGRYEVQVLDSYDNVTYADGQAGAIYGQFPPLVNASLAPGRWQTYDIVFRGPRFRGDGTLERPARMTVLHNGILIQDNAELTGPTANKERPPYAVHPGRLPITLQDHGHPVRFRNIWIRELTADAEAR